MLQQAVEVCWSKDARCLTPFCSANMTQGQNSEFPAERFGNMLAMRNGTLAEGTGIEETV